MFHLGRACRTPPSWILHPSSASIKDHHRSEPWSQERIPQVHPCLRPAGEPGEQTALVSAVREDLAAPWGAPPVPPELIAPRQVETSRWLDGSGPGKGVRIQGPEGPLVSTYGRVYKPETFPPRAGLAGVCVLLQLRPSGSVRSHAWTGRPSHWSPQHTCAHFTDESTRVKGTCKGKVK